MSENKDEKFYDRESLILLEMTEKIMSANSYTELRDALGLYLTEKMSAGSCFFHVIDPQLSTSRFFSIGVDTKTVSKLKERCLLESDQLIKNTQLDNSCQPLTVDSFTLFPLFHKTACVGLLGIELRENHPAPTTRLWNHFLVVMANVISCISVHQEEKKQLEFLNTYMTISSLLAQEIGLHDMLEATLYCCMDMFSAEAASILMLDNRKESFIFYQVEGDAKQALTSAELPIDQGIAGAVLKSGESEMVNDLASDPRFHRGMDEKTNFHSRSMIAVPLIAGEEQVGVLEVLNKNDSRNFLEEDHLSLKILAEEIAFAIRNAKIFDYVVTSYCKQRQGLNTCKGCKRPLGTWTPCVKYRESLI